MLQQNKNKKKIIWTIREPNQTERSDQQFEQKAALGSLFFFFCSEEFEKSTPNTPKRENREKK